MEFVLDELAPGKLSDKEAKALGAIIWEVLPTGQWLSRHGWRVEEACPRCEEADDLVHALAGCVLDGPEAHTMARREWQEALCPGSAIEPDIIVDDVAFRVREYVNGVEMPVGTIRFRAELKVFTDGSAKDIGKRFGRSSGSAVQVLPDGTSVAIIAAVQQGWQQSAISGEVLGLALLGHVLARGQPADTEHQAGSVRVGVDCQAVISAFFEYRRGWDLRKFPHAGSSATTVWRRSASYIRSPLTSGRRTPDVQAGTTTGKVMTSRMSSPSEPSRGLPPQHGRGSNSSGPGTSC